MQIWVKVQVQNLPLHKQDLAPTQTLFASLPDEDWTFSHYNATVVNVNTGTNWPLSGLTGE